MLVLSKQNIINLQQVKLSSTMPLCMYLRKKAQRMTSQTVQQINSQKGCLIINVLIWKISVQIHNQFRFHKNIMVTLVPRII